ncbi:MAG: tyrosine-type recombinase/integrase [Candidatus Cryptobacteroides sp.]
MNPVDEYILYIESVRRYSPRTVAIYRDSLGLFLSYLSESEGFDVSLADAQVLEGYLVPTIVRSYELWLLDSRGMAPVTVSQHLSVLSGFCRFSMKAGRMKSNPVKSVARPKAGKRLPSFCKRDSMDEYFEKTKYCASADMIYVSTTLKETKEHYEARLRRLIVLTLYTCGIRRAELISLKKSSVDFGRKVLRIVGKGDKMREIPLVPSLSKEISLYLQAVETMAGIHLDDSSPLFVTFTGKPLYPMFVERAIKAELGDVAEITGRKSPHVLRHTLATELLDGGADLNSIKEMLGHSSLAATQVYTHNSIAKLKKVYESAHPRANKNGGKNGD